MAQKKYYETSEFKKLRKEWVEKLKDDGFEETESDSYLKYDTIKKQEFTPNFEWMVYNEKCIAYLHSTKFEDKTDEFIFEQHCEGRSNHDIAKKLTNNNLNTLHQSNVARRLLKILAKAGITPVEFNV